MSRGTKGERLTTDLPHPWVVCEPAAVIGGVNVVAGTDTFADAITEADRLDPLYARKLFVDSRERVEARRREAISPIDRKEGT